MIWFVNNIIFHMISYTTMSVFWTSQLWPKFANALSNIFNVLLIAVKLNIYSFNDAMAFTACVLSRGPVLASSKV